MSGGRVAHFLEFSAFDRGPQAIPSLDYTKKPSGDREEKLKFSLCSSHICHWIWYHTHLKRQVIAAWFMHFKTASPEGFTQKVSLKASWRISRLGQTQTIYHGGPRTLYVRWDSDGILETKCTVHHNKGKRSVILLIFSVKSIYFLSFFLSHPNDKMRDRKRESLDR